MEKQPSFAHSKHHLAALSEWVNTADVPSTPVIVANYNYVLSILGQSARSQMVDQLSFKRIDLKGDQFTIHCQGSSLFCGLCAVNNTVCKDVEDFNFFTVAELDSIADRIWLTQATEVKGLAGETFQKINRMLKEGVFESR